MSSFYILEKQDHGSSKTYTDDEISKIKTHIASEDKKLLDINATRQLKGDLDLGNNSIIGFIDIRASNSATTKSWQQGKFLSISGGTMSGDLNLGGRKILNVGSDLSGTSAVTKTYVDGEISKLSTSSSIKTYIDNKITQVLTQVRKYNLYNYSFGCNALPHNSWTYPMGPRNNTPHVWMNIDGLNEHSFFELGVHSFDNDDPLSGNLTIEYRLECMDYSGALRSWTFFNGPLNGYRLPSENFFCLNLKKYFKDFPTGNYRQFKIARLSLRRKWPGTQGNESMITFAIGKA